MNTELLLPMLRLILGTGFVYLTYVLLLKKRVNGTTGRLFLLGGTLLFTLLPFLPPAEASETTAYLIQLPEVATGTLTDTPGKTNIRWFQWAYTVVMGFAALLFLVKLAKLIRLKRSGNTYTENGTHITETAAIRYPFSFAKRVFLPLNMDAQTRSLVLAHERVHIHQLHTYDVLLFEALKIAAWFNPFYYLLEKELRQTHEFTADEVMLQNGVSTSRYCEALLSCALAGMRVPVNYFHGSQIKTRIYMMKKTKNRRQGVMLLAAATFVLGALTVTTPRLFGQTPKTEVFTTVEQMPEYPGGNQAMATFMAQTVRYPEVAQKAKLEGKVLVSFVVAADGQVKDVAVKKSLSTETDAEAVRAVKAMPKWIPGKQNGKEVAVQFVLPVAFKL